MNKSILRMTVASSKKRPVTIDEFFSRGKKTSPAKRQKVEEEGTQIKGEKENDIPVDETTGGKETVTPREDNETKSPMKATTSDSDKKLAFKNRYVNMLTEKQRALLKLEIDTMDPSWFVKLSTEFAQPYFIKLKEFLQEEAQVRKQTIFPPAKDIYSWSRLTPFNEVRVVIIGQDPYHNFNQAHGLAFSVKPPTPAPPSLKNMYSELKAEYNDFVVETSCGDLTCWAKQGVLLFNTALTVRAHSPNSHSKCGWDIFAKRVIEVLIKDREAHPQKSLVFMLWGSNAIKLVEGLAKDTLKKYKNILVLKSVHPSPLSASRGFFGCGHFKTANEWLYNDRHERMIDWSVVPGKYIEDIRLKNELI